MEQIENIRKQLLDQFAESEVINSTYKRPASTDLVSKIDSTLLSPTATYDQIEKLCQDAREYGFYSVCVPPCYLTFATDLLAETKILPITVVGFPHGSATTETKTFEALDAIDWGAKEIDMVLNISKLKSGKLEEVYQDILSVVQQADEVPVKVILETAVLTTEEKIQATILAQIAGAAFVKTSTGFSTGGATIEDIKLLKQIVGEKTGIKASGGIKNFVTVMNMISAGADRIGTSSGVEIMKEKSDNA